MYTYIIIIYVYTHLYSTYTHNSGEIKTLNIPVVFIMYGNAIMINNRLENIC